MSDDPKQGRFMLLHVLTTAAAKIQRPRVLMSELLAYMCNRKYPCRVLLSRNMMSVSQSVCPGFIQQDRFCGGKHRPTLCLRLAEEGQRSRLLAREPSDANLSGQIVNKDFFPPVIT